jgi:hypothetical protein
VTRESALEQSREMTPVEGTIDVAIPADALWASFLRSKRWPQWNRCFYWVHNRELALGRRLIWAFQPIRPRYLYKMFAIAKIVELDAAKRRVTWAVTAMPGFYARHTYHVDDLGGGRSRFGSWEQAMGLQIRVTSTRRFWTAHFTFVKDRSLEGAKRLEAIYARDGSLNAI